MPECPSRHHHGLAEPLVMEIYDGGDGGRFHPLLPRSSSYASSYFGYLYGAGRPSHGHLASGLPSLSPPIGGLPAHGRPFDDHHGGCPLFLLGAAAHLLHAGAQQ